MQIKQWNETKRGPELSVSFTAPPSNNSKCNAALLARLPEIQQRLYILFSSYHDYNSFSNKAWAPSQGLWGMDSIESVHDVIHTYSGMRGHMTFIPLSSFDPLFFFHHTMTDRLIAMWQVLNPSAWITPMLADQTTFTALNGTVQTSQSPLTPFYYSSDGTFWDSDMSRSTEVFGYTYADTDPSRGPDAIRESLIRKIGEWYAPSSPIGQMSAAQRAGTQVHPFKHADIRNFTDGRFRPNIKLGAVTPPTTHIVEGGHYTEWIANVRISTEAPDGLYTIYFFLGSPPVHEFEWEQAQNQAGSMTIYTLSHMAGSPSQVSGAFPLTSALLKVVGLGAIEDLTPSAVTPFLKAALQFRVLGSNDVEVEASQVGGLWIGISSTDVTVASEHRLPSWGRPVMRLELFPCFSLNGTGGTSDVGLGRGAAHVNG